MKKKFLILLLVFCFLFSVKDVNAESYNFSDPWNNKDTNNYLKDVSTVNVDKPYPNDYTFAMGKVEDKPNENYNGVNDVNLNNWQQYKDNNANVKDALFSGHGTASNAVPDIKGSYSKTYYNVNTYNGSCINVKATVMDFENNDVRWGSNTPVILLRSDYIGVYVLAVKWVTIKLDFYDGGPSNACTTSTENHISVKGYSTYKDVDAQQGVLIHDNNKGIYIANISELKHTKVNDFPYIYDATGVATNDLPTTEFSETFEGESITRTFSFTNYSREPNSSNGAIIYDAFMIPSLLTSDPIKSVNKSTVKLDEEFTYTVKQDIIAINSNHYFQSYTFTDTLESPLNANASKVKITNENNTDVTDKFNITTNNQTITAQLKDPSDSNFYGHTYSYNITTNIKKDADLNNYKSDESYIIPNKANISYKANVSDNEKEINKETNQVDIKYTPTKPASIIINVPNTLANLPLPLKIFSIIIIIVAIGTISYILHKNKIKKNIKYSK